MNATTVDEPFTILIVDDEEHVIRGLSRSLKTLGHRVFGAATGKEALALTRTEHPDFVLLDILLAGENGLELCSQLRQPPQRPMVITMSGQPPAQVLMDALVAGAVAHLLKPVRVDELIQRMKNHMANRRDGSLPPPRALPIEARADSLVVTVGDPQFQLTQLQLDLVLLLLANADRALSAVEICRRLELASEKSARELVRNTRRSLGDLEKKELIRTERGAGYVIRILDTQR